MSQPSTSPATQKTVTPVINNEERLRMIQLPAIKNKAGMTPGPVLILVPGVNFPDTEQWTRAKENPEVQQLLKTKIKPSRAPEQNPEMVGHVKLVERGPVSADSPLASLTEEDSILLVDEMFHLPTLHKLLAEETRPGVAKALKTQIDKIEKPRTETKSAR